MKFMQGADERITPHDLKREGVENILEKVRRTKGYYVTNTERDQSQSDFRTELCRIPRFWPLRRGMQPVFFP